MGGSMEINAPVCEGTRWKSRGPVVLEKPQRRKVHRPGYGFRRTGIAPCGLGPIRAIGYGAMEGRCFYARLWRIPDKCFIIGDNGLRLQSSDHVLLTTNAPLALQG